MSAKFKECEGCYFNNRSPEICETCVRADKFEPPLNEDISDDDINDLTEFTPEDM